MREDEIENERPGRRRHRGVLSGFASLREKRATPMPEHALQEEPSGCFERKAGRLADTGEWRRPVRWGQDVRVSGTFLPYKAAVVFLQQYS